MVIQREFINRERQRDGERMTFVRKKEDNHKDRTQGFDTTMVLVYFCFLMNPFRDFSLMAVLHNCVSVCVCFIKKGGWWEGSPRNQRGPIYSEAS